MYSVTGDTTSLVPGFPIRTSSDPRSVDSSPRHIAASHVLHRLLMPRHPPCALKHLQHKTKSLNKLEIAHQHQAPKRSLFDARNHYPQIKHHTPPPKRGDNQTHPHQGVRSPPVSQDRDEEVKGPVVSKPNSVSDDQFSTGVSPPTNVCRAPEPHPLQVRPIHRIAQITEPPQPVGGPGSRGAP
jgi:hypothetical protein